MHSRGRGVTSVWQTQGKLSHLNAMQFACLLNSVHSRLLLGWHAKYLAVGEKRTWVVASKYNIVHTTQCITLMRPVMMRVLCMQGEGLQTLEDSLCETRDFRKHKASPSLLSLINALTITPRFQRMHTFLVLWRTNTLYSCCFPPNEVLCVMYAEEWFVLMNRLVHRRRSKIRIAWRLSQQTIVLLIIAHFCLSFRFYWQIKLFLCIFLTIFSGDLRIFKKNRLLRLGSIGHHSRALCVIATTCSVHFKLDRGSVLPKHYIML